MGERSEIRGQNCGFGIADFEMFEGLYDSYDFCDLSEILLTAYERN